MYILTLLFIAGLSLLYKLLVHYHIWLHNGTAKSSSKSEMKKYQKKEDVWLSAEDCPIKKVGNTLNYAYSSSGRKPLMEHFVNYRKEGELIEVYYGLAKDAGVYGLVDKDGNLRFSVEDMRWYTIKAEHKNATPKIEKEGLWKMTGKHKAVCMYCHNEIKFIPKGKAYCRKCHCKNIGILSPEGSIRYFNR